MSLSDRSYDRLGQLLVELANELRPLVGQLVAAAAADAGMTDDRLFSAGDTDPWLTPSAAAERVGVHRRTIYRALATGTLEGGQLPADRTVARDVGEHQFAQILIAIERKSRPVDRNVDRGAAAFRRRR